MCFRCTRLDEELLHRCQLELAKQKDALTASVAIYRVLLEYRMRLDAAEREHCSDGTSTS
jgi:hypothetical protein